MSRRKLLCAVGAISISAAATIAASRSALAASRDDMSRQWLKAWLDALTRHDLESFRLLYAESGLIQHQALAMSAPATGGREAVVTYFAKRLAAFPDLVVTSDQSMVDGELICSNTIYSGTHRGEYLGVEPTGKEVTFNSTDILRVRGGVALEHWGAVDLYGLIRQLRG